MAHTTPPNPNAGNKEAQLTQITPPQELVEKVCLLSMPDLLFV